MNINQPTPSFVSGPPRMMDGMNSLNTSLDSMSIRTSKKNSRGSIPNVPPNLQQPMQPFTPPPQSGLNSSTPAPVGP
eukprot:Pgem_evm1s15372